MKRYILFLLFILKGLNAFTQLSYYVDQQDGASDNDGLTPTAAFDAIEPALLVVEPSDTIFIMGTYKNSKYNASYTFANAHDAHLWHSENSIRIADLHGSPDKYITIKAHDNSTKLKGDGANIFRVQNCSYLRIEGLEIVGEVSRIPLATANAIQFAYIDKNTVLDETAPTEADIRYRDQDCVSNCTAGAVVDGEVYSDLRGLSVGRPSYIDTRGLYLTDVHHIDILNNEIHHMPGGGLRVSDCEDINIIGNEVHNCSRKSFSGTHALVVTKATSTRNTNDYRINILSNKIHHNYNEQYSWAPTKTIITPHIDEGKGISLQRNETTDEVNWDNGRILVANNICYFNGFSGIHSNDGNRIDIVNNTCYFNSYTKSITEGISSNNGGNIGISAQGGSNVRIFNNISIIDVDLSKSAIASNISAEDGLVVKNNLIYGTSRSGTTATINENANVASVQVNPIKEDPLFTDPTNFDFSLQPNSLAIGSANTKRYTSHDYFGKQRDENPDRGAIEYFAPLANELLNFKATLVQKNFVNLNWTTASEFNLNFFRLERSIDGKQWDIIKKVGAKGASSSYDAVDENPVSKMINYYRLQQVDINGHISYSPIQSISISDFHLDKFSIYPNPASNLINLDSDDEIVTISVYEYSGKNIDNSLNYTSVNNKKMIIDVSSLTDGIYFIIINNKEIRKLHISQNK